MTRAGIALALLIAVYGALLFADLIGQAVDNFRRDASEAHSLASPDDLEADARNPWGMANAGVDFNHLNLFPVLGAGSERML